MTSGGGVGPSPAAGGPARHVPVLRDEVLAALDVRAGGLYLDGTFGAGGHTQAILSFPETRVVALDRDPTAVEAGASLVSEMYGRLKLVPGRFGDLDRLAREHGFEPGAFDGILLDVGVSSMQLDQEARGFSFRAEGPLDMRMERTGQTAADIVNRADEETIADILYHYGEERAARRIARAIVADRAARPFETTRTLADLIARVVPGRSDDNHPATRAFQALRIAVNDELGELVRGLAAAARMLKAGGRLAVITFHSLEDRIVKRFFAAASGKKPASSRHAPGVEPHANVTFRVPGRQPIVPSESEIRANPRARSAKLRYAIRTASPAGPVPASVRALAELPIRRRGK